MYFSPTNDGKRSTTKNFLYKFLDEYNLRASFDQNKISFSVDGALYGDIVEMFTENGLYPAVTICLPHNFGRISKRTLDERLHDHWPEGPQKINVSDMSLSL